MATLKTNSYDGRYMCFDCSSEVTGPGKTKITWELYARGGNSTYYYVGPITARINGEEVYSFDGRGQQATGRKAKGSFTVNHGTDGVGTYTWSIKAAIYKTSVNCTGSGTYTLASKNYPYTSISPATDLKVAFNNGTAGTSINIPSKTTYQIYLDEKGANTTTDKQLKFTWTAAKAGTQNPVKNQILQYWYNEQWNTFATLAGDATSYTMSLADFYEKTKPGDGSGSSKGFQIMAVPSKYGNDKGSNNVHVLNYYYYSLPYDLTLEFSTKYKISETQTITDIRTLELNNNTNLNASITLPQGDGTFSRVEERTVTLKYITTYSSNGEIGPYKTKINNQEMSAANSVVNIKGVSSFSVYCYNDIFTGNALTINIANTDTPINNTTVEFNFGTTTAKIKNKLPDNCDGWIHLYYKLNNDSQFSELADVAFKKLAADEPINLVRNGSFASNENLFTATSIDLKIEYYYSNGTAYSTIKTTVYENLDFYSIAQSSFNNNTRNKLEVDLTNNDNIVGIHFDTSYLNSEYSDYITTTINNTSLELDIIKSLYGSSFLSQNGDNFTLSGKPFFFTKAASQNNIGKFQSDTVTSHTVNYIPKQSFSVTETDAINMFQNIENGDNNFFSGFNIGIDYTKKDIPGRLIINDVRLNCDTYYDESKMAMILKVQGNDNLTFEDYGIDFYCQNLTIPIIIQLLDGGIYESYSASLLVSSIPNLQAKVTLFPVGKSQLVITTSHILSETLLDTIKGNFNINGSNYSIQLNEISPKDESTSLGYSTPANTYTILLDTLIPQILPNITITSSGSIIFDDSSASLTLTNTNFNLPVWFNPSLNIKNLNLELNDGNKLTLTGSLVNNNFSDCLLGYENNNENFTSTLAILVDGDFGLGSFAIDKADITASMSLDTDQAAAYLSTTQHSVQFTLNTTNNVNGATLTTIIHQNFFDIAPPLSLRANTVGIHTKNPENEKVGEGEDEKGCCLVVSATQDTKLIKFIVLNKKPILIDLEQGTISGAILDGGTWTQS